MFQGILAALISGGQTVSERYIFSRKHYAASKYAEMGFVWIFIMMLPAAFFLFKYTSEMTQWVNLVYLGLYALFASLFNIFILTSLENMEVESAEPLILSSGIFTIIIAILMFPAERNWINVALGGIAALAVILSHFEKRHFFLDKYSVICLAGALFMAIHNVLAAKLLVIYDPFSLYFARATIVTIIMLAIFGLKKKDFAKEFTAYTVGINAFCILANILFYWSYNTVGVVVTTLLMTLAPIAAYWGSYFFLKEKIHLKNIIATVVIVACVTASQLL